MYASSLMDLDNRSRRSSPIEIPQRRRPMPTYSPQFSIEQSQSPEMIFEMSPITSIFPSPPTTLIPSSPRNPYGQEPFLYHFPELKTCTANANNRLHSAPLRHHEIPISHTFVPSKHGNKRQRKATKYEPDEKFPAAYGDTIAIKKAAMTKIVGFSPPGPSQRNSVQVSPTQDSLPTPPGRSFPWSPWILPGRSNSRGEELLSTDVAPGAIGFENYLLRRTENAECIFNGLQLVSSMRA
ncbi:hypothetical protein AX15_000065 [Amanita polypyramis BW_CC]|nr:hypothetical protein AX15_000065 [Amanita polypyramis BW_CC]